MVTVASSADHTMSFLDKIQAPQYRHPYSARSDSYNSTDTNALSAGADSPGESGACSFCPESLP
jgi:hypothetical protein